MKNPHPLSPRPAGSCPVDRQGGPSGTPGSPPSGAAPRPRAPLPPGRVSGCCSEPARGVLRRHHLSLETRRAPGPGTQWGGRPARWEVREAAQGHPGACRKGGLVPLHQHVVGKCQARHEPPPLVPNPSKSCNPSRLLPSCVTHRDTEARGEKGPPPERGSGELGPSPCDLQAHLPSLRSISKPVSQSVTSREPAGPPRLPGSHQDGRWPPGGWTTPHLAATCLPMGPRPLGPEQAVRIVPRPQGKSLPGWHPQHKPPPPPVGIPSNKPKTDALSGSPGPRQQVPGCVPEAARGHLMEESRKQEHGPVHTAFSLEHWSHWTGLELGI